MKFDKIKSNIQRFPSVRQSVIQRLHCTSHRNKFRWNKNIIFWKI